MANTIETNDDLKTKIDQAYVPKKRWGLIIFILSVPLVIAGGSYFAYSSYRAHQAAVNAERHVPSVVNERKSTPLGVESEPIRIKATEIASTPQATPMTTPIDVVPVAQNSPQVKPAVPVTKVSRFDAPVMITEPTNQAGSAVIDNHPDVEMSQNRPNQVRNTGLDDSPSNNPNGMRLTPTATPKARAGLLGNRNYILAKGNSIECELNTAIISTLPGIVTCTVPVNTYSDNGKVVLIERGSQLTGEYTGLKQGETRLSVLWDRIKTTEGVVVDLNSLGTDQLGRSGFDGDIDNHWGERIGAAFLMSTFKDLVAYQTAKDGNASVTTSTYQNTQNTGNDLASQILKQTINMPPTLVKNQGERIAIVVARDLDFADVYRLEIDRIGGKSHD